MKVDINEFDQARPVDEAEPAMLLVIYVLGRPRSAIECLNILDKVTRGPLLL